MVSLTVWIYCTFQRKRVVIRWVLHLTNISFPTTSLCCPRRGPSPFHFPFSVRAACSHHPFQRIRLPIRSPFSSCLQHHDYWYVTASVLFTHISLRARSAFVATLVPCNFSLSWCCAIHFTPWSFAVCLSQEMALVEDIIIIYLSMPSLRVILLCPSLAWYPCCQHRSWPALWTFWP